MTKKQVEKPRREPTRRQLSQWQRQKKRQRIIFGVGAFILAAVLGIVGSGWYITQYRPLQQTVIKVNDTEFNMNYYVKMLKHHGEGYPANFMRNLADEVVRGIEQNELIKQETVKLDITVSDGEVDDELKSHDPPFNDAHRDVVRTALLINKLRDEYFEQQVPLSAEQRYIMAMFLESNSQVAEVRARLENGEDFAELAEELSLENFSKSESGDLGWRPRDILPGMMGTSIPEEYAFSAEVGVLSQPLYDEALFKRLGYWLIEVLEMEEEEPKEAHLQVILLGSEEEALSARARLEAGEDFAALVEELSQHDYSKKDGGDLGWLLPEEMSPDIEEFVFGAETKLKTVSEPIRDETAVTKGGYWLVKVLEKDDNREISDDDRGWLKDKALSEWITSLWDDPENEIEDYLDNEKKAWAIEKAVKS